MSNSTLTAYFVQYRRAGEWIDLGDSDCSSLDTAKILFDDVCKWMPTEDIEIRIVKRTQTITNTDEVVE